jgi:hypothetical protein
MDGFVQVRYVDHEAHYLARCACGWEGGEAGAIEFSELSLLGHFDRHEKTEED